MLYFPRTHIHDLRGKARASFSSETRFFAAYNGVKISIFAVLREACRALVKLLGDPECLSIYNRDYRRSPVHCAIDYRHVLFVKKKQPFKPNY